MYSGSSGGFLKFLKGIDIAAFLDGTSKTLNVINQAIPVFYQVKPIIGNVGTLFKISNAMNSDNSNSVETAKVLEQPKTGNSPIFFV